MSFRLHIYEHIADRLPSRAVETDSFIKAMELLESLKIGPGAELAVVIGDDWGFASSSYRPLYRAERGGKDFRPLAKQEQNWEQ